MSIVCEVEVKLQKKVIDIGKSILKNPTPIPLILDAIDRANDIKTKCTLACKGAQVAINSGDFDAAHKLSQLTEDMGCSCTCSLVDTSPSNTSNTSKLLKEII